MCLFQLPVSIKAAGSEGFYTGVKNGYILSRQYFVFCGGFDASGFIRSFFGMTLIRFLRSKNPVNLYGREHLLKLLQIYFFILPGQCQDFFSLSPFFLLSIYRKQEYRFIFTHPDNVGIPGIIISFHRHQKSILAVDLDSAGFVRLLFKFGIEHILGHDIRSRRKITQHGFNVQLPDSQHVSKV